MDSKRFLVTLKDCDNHPLKKSRWLRDDRVLAVCPGGFEKARWSQNGIGVRESRPTPRKWGTTAKVNGAIREPALPPRNECRTVGEWGGC